MMCLAYQLSRGHDQPVGVEGAQLFVRFAFVTHVGGPVPRMEAEGSVPALSRRPGQA